MWPFGKSRDAIVSQSLNRLQSLTRNAGMRGKSIEQSNGVHIVSVTELKPPEVCRVGGIPRPCSEPSGKHLFQDGRVGSESLVIDIASALARRTIHRSISSSTPERIDQSTYHSPPSRLTLLSSTISLHAGSSACLALHPSSQTVVSLFLLRSSYKPRWQSPSRRPGQNLSPVRKPDDPANTRRDRRSRQLRQCKLHWQKV
jgi:hypothetical protein